MEACYAEGSKSRGDAVPQISLRPLAHQNCIRRAPIVAVAPTNDSGRSSGTTGLVTSNHNDKHHYNNCCGDKQPKS
jgi:hypothetical protein